MEEVPYTRRESVVQPVLTLTARDQINMTSLTFAETVERFMFEAERSGFAGVTRVDHWDTTEFSAWVLRPEDV